jgi:hypothetical protein
VSTELPYACPNCGTRVGNVRYCPNCGMDFAAPRPAPTPPPPAPAYTPPAAPPQASAAKLTVLDLVGLPLAIAGALLALLASFLPWFSGLGQKPTYWEIAKAQDIFLLLFVLAVIGISAAVLISPGTRVLRLLALALVAGLIDFVFTTPIEFISRDETGFSGRQAGEFVALLAAVMLAAAVVLLLINLRSGPAPERVNPLLLIGLIGIGFVGLLQPLVELLPVSHGVSTWETYKAADILRALVGLGTAGLAVAAILLPRVTLLALSVFVVGCYTATDNLVGSIEELAFPSRGAEVFVSLLLLAPIGIASLVLLALGTRPKSG